MSIVANSQQILNPKIHSYNVALSLGLKSRSAWKKDGYVVPEDAVPDGYVYMHNKEPLIEKIKGQAHPWQLVVREEGVHKWVTQDYYEVYGPKTQAENGEEEGKKENTNTPSTLTVFNATPTPTPTIPPTTMDNSSFSLGFLGDLTKSPSEENEPVNSVRSYVPEGLILPPSATPYEDNIKFFLGLIWRKRTEDYRKPDEYVPLKAEYLRNYVTGFREFWPLIQNVIVERDNYYVQGQKAYGYRLCEPYRSRHHRLTPIRDNAIVKKVRIEKNRSLKLPVHRHLRDNLDRVNIDVDGFRRRFETLTNSEHYRPIVQSIADKAFELTVDEFATRVHTNLTRLYKPLRSLLRVDGQRLGEIDICNSQPLFLGLHLRQRGIPADRYLELVQSGRLYDHLAERCEMTRDEAKEELLKVFYSKNGYASKLKKVFAEEFPEVAEVIFEAKKKDHRRLAQMMQKAEARFMIHTVCDRLRADHPDTFVSTIHDSILCKIEDMELVRDVVVAEFKDYGITPRLRATSFDEKYETDYDAKRDQLLRIFNHGRTHEA